jgi:hypothetical protein
MNSDLLQSLGHFHAWEHGFLMKKNKTGKNKMALQIAAQLINDPL